jgi:hypothetical protein
MTTDYSLSDPFWRMWWPAFRRTIAMATRAPPMPFDVDRLRRQPLDPRVDAATEETHGPGSASP